MAYKLGQRYVEEGRWIDFEGARFLVRGTANNADFKRAKARLERPYRRKIERGTLDPETEEDLSLKAMAEALLLDWEGVEDENGPVPYDKDIGFQQLKNDPNLALAIIEAATDDDAYKVEKEEKTVKKSSSTSSSTAKLAKVSTS